MPTRAKLPPARGRAPDSRGARSQRHRVVVAGDPAVDRAGDPHRTGTRRTSASTRTPRAGAAAPPSAIPQARATRRTMATASFSDIPGSPTHPIDHDCFACQGAHAPGALHCRRAPRFDCSRLPRGSPSDPVSQPWRVRRAMLPTFHPEARGPHFHSAWRSHPPPASTPGCARLADPVAGRPARPHRSSRRAASLRKSCEGFDMNGTSVCRRGRLVLALLFILCAPAPRCPVPRPATALVGGAAFRRRSRPMTHSSRTSCRCRRIRAQRVPASGVCRVAQPAATESARSRCRHHEARRQNFGIGFGASYPKAEAGRRGPPSAAATTPSSAPGASSTGAASANQIASRGVDWAHRGQRLEARGRRAVQNSTAIRHFFFGGRIGDLSPDAKFTAADRRDRATPASAVFRRGRARRRSAATARPDRSAIRTCCGGVRRRVQLPYLQSFVQDVGLRRAVRLDDSTIVEFAMSTARSMARAGTTGARSIPESSGPRTYFRARRRKRRFRSTRRAAGTRMDRLRLPFLPGRPVPELARLRPLFR